MKALSLKTISNYSNGELVSNNEDLLIDSYSTDSRKVTNSTLFIPIVGENNDGHDFIKSAYENGCHACFSQRRNLNNLPSDLSVIYVDNTRYALQRLGERVREDYPIPIVGITGSVGKTSTKEMIAIALSNSLNVLKTQGNMNSQLGLPQMMLMLEDKHQIGVIELGMSLFGEMERISKVAKVNTAVITNIGMSHIGNLHSQENILKEKLRIVDHMKEGDLLLVNGNDSRLFKLKEDFDILADKTVCDDLNKKEELLKYYQSILYPTTVEILKTLDIKSFGTNDNCDYVARDVLNTAMNSSFTYEGTRIELNVGGMHNILNALAAIGVAKRYNVPLEEAKKGIFDYKSSSMRGEIKKVKDFFLMNDSYNASVDSIKAACDIFSKIECNRHIAVLADILELGEMSTTCHEEVGRVAGDHDIDILLTVGNEGKKIANSAKKIGKIKFIKEFEDNLSCYNELVKLIEPNDAVLLKGSRGMKLDEIADLLEN